MKNVITTIALTLMASAALANPGELDQVSHQPIGTEVTTGGITSGAYHTFTVATDSPDCTKIHALEVEARFDGGQSPGTVAQVCAQLVADHAALETALAAVRSATTQLAVTTNLINATEARNRAEYFPLYMAHNQLSNEQIVLTGLAPQQSQARRAAQDLWNDAQEDVRAAIQRDRTYQQSRIDEAQAVRDIRPNSNVPRSCPEQTPVGWINVCESQWNVFFQRRAQYYSVHGSYFNLVGHMADAASQLELTDSNPEIEAIVFASADVTIYREAFGAAATAEDATYARLQVLATEVPAAEAAMTAHPYHD